MQVTKTIDTPSIARLFGCEDITSKNLFSHSDDILGSFKREWFDKAIAILIEHQDVEVESETSYYLFTDNGIRVFATLDLVEPEPEYAKYAQGRCITRLRCIGAQYPLGDGRFRISDFSPTVKSVGGVVYASCTVKYPDPILELVSFNRKKEHATTL